MIQIDQDQQLYINLSVHHRYLRYRRLGCVGNVEQDAFNKSLQALEAAAKTVYQRFINRYNLYCNGWLTHQCWLSELARLRWFLLDSDIVNHRYLHFYELLQTVNRFI